MQHDTEALAIYAESFLGGSGEAVRDLATTMAKVYAEHMAHEPTALDLLAALRERKAILSFEDNGRFDLEAYAPHESGAHGLTDARVLEELGLTN